MPLMDMSGHRAQIQVPHHAEVFLLSLGQIENAAYAWLKSKKKTTNKPFIEIENNKHQSSCVVTVQQ